MSFYFNKKYVSYFLSIFMCLGSQYCSASIEEEYEKYYENGGKCFKPKDKIDRKINDDKNIQIEKLKYDSSRKQYYFGEKLSTSRKYQDFIQDNNAEESISSIKYNLQGKGQTIIIADEYTDYNDYKDFIFKTARSSAYGLFTGLTSHYAFSYYNGTFDTSIVPKVLSYGAIFGGTVSVFLNTAYGRKLNPLSSESILVPGRDRRKKVKDDQVTEWPWCVHGQLQSLYTNSDGTKGSYIGSGTLIGNKYVLTAAHNLYDYKLKKYADSVTFLPGKFGHNVPWSSESKNFKIHLKYKNARTYEERKENDIGVLELKDALGDDLGYFGFNVFNDKIKKVNVTGYPGYPSNGKYMYTMSGDIRHLTDNRIYYDIDTYGGQSGSGVYFELNKDKYLCVATHAYGIECKSWCQSLTFDHKYNSGTTITKDKLIKLQEWTTES